MPKLADVTAAPPLMQNQAACVAEPGLSALQLQMQAAPKKRFEKGQFERRARMEPDKLEALLFQLFEREVHGTLSECCRVHSSSAAICRDVHQLLFACMSSQMRQILTSHLAGAVDTTKACGADRSACCFSEGDLAKDC